MWLQRGFWPSAVWGQIDTFKGLATLRDGLGYPQDSDERFRVASYISSPFPRLSWRNVSSSKPRHCSDWLGRVQLRSYCCVGSAKRRILCFFMGADIFGWKRSKQ